MCHLFIISLFIILSLSFLLFLPFPLYSLSHSLNFTLSLSLSLSPITVFNDALPSRSRRDKSVFIFPAVLIFILFNSIGGLIFNLYQLQQKFIDVELSFYKIHYSVVAATISGFNILTIFYGKHIINAIRHPENLSIITSRRFIIKLRQAEVEMFANILNE